MIAAGMAITIEYANKNTDNVINEEDLNAQIETLTDGQEVVIGGSTYTWSADLKNALERLFRSSPATVPSASDNAADKLGSAHNLLADTMRQVQEKQQQVDNLQAQLASASPGADADALKEQVKLAQAELATLKEKLEQSIRTVEQYNRATGKTAANGIDTAAYEMIGETPPGGEGDSKATFAMTSSGTSGTGAGTTGAKATTIGGFTPPTGWGTDPMGGSKAFSTDAFMQSSFMEESALSSFDSVLKSQSKGKQLMMLFFYFARMAESGDLGAMYQFMKFLTYIVSKDKATQQVEMGKKLIELQDLSRQWTDKLLGTSTDANDPNSSANFTKVMTQVQAETNSIATSQKLISQMMEEFAQVVETLTNVTKSALEANGRVQRTVSSMR